MRPTILRDLRTLYDLSERKRDRDRHEHRDRLSLAGAWCEAPLTRGFDRFLVEAKGSIQRSNDAHVADGAVWLDDALEEYITLDLRAHRLCGVLGLDLLQ